MALAEAQGKFLDLMRSFKSDVEQANFLGWISTNWGSGFKVAENDGHKDILKAISHDLRTTLPLNATLASETIITPRMGPESDCDPTTTVHVDDFLYDEEEVDRLVENGELSRYYCKNCKTFISHSMSIEKSQYIFQALLPSLTGKTVIDVGSRLGPVLYGAYCFSNAAKIIGVEMNGDFCQLQNGIVQKYGFTNRIEIVHNNIFNVVHLLSNADVIILNNVFSFFCDTETCVAAWRLLSQNVKAGAVLVTIPHMEVTFSYLQVGFDLSCWVRELPLSNTEVPDIDNWEDHLRELKHYEVIAPLNAAGHALSS